MSDSELEKLLENYNEDNGYDNISDDFNSSDLILPSQRTKVVDNKKKVTKARPKLDLEALLGSDDLSPAINIETKKNEPKFVVETKPPDSIDKLEENLMNYIDNSLNKVKMQFKDELNYSLHQTSETDSAISAFILGLPHDVEEVINEELNEYRRPQITDLPSVDNSIDFHLSAIRKSLQANIKESHLLPISSEKITELDRSVSYALDKVETNIKNPLDEFKIERNTSMNEGQPFSVGFSPHNYSSKATLLETEATLHQLNVALELLEEKKSRVMETQDAWRDMHLKLQESNDSSSLSEVKQLAELTNEHLSQNHGNGSGETISKAVSSIKDEINQISKANANIGAEMEKLAKRVSRKNAKRVEREYKYRAPSEKESDNSLICEIKERLDMINRDHDKMLK